MVAIVRHRAGCGVLWLRARTMALHRRGLVRDSGVREASRSGAALAPTRRARAPTALVQPSCSETCVPAALIASLVRNSPPAHAAPAAHAVALHTPADLLGAWAPRCPVRRPNEIGPHETRARREPTRRPRAADRRTAAPRRHSFAADGDTAVYRACQELVRTLSGPSGNRCGRRHGARPVARRARDPQAASRAAGAKRGSVRTKVLPAPTSLSARRSPPMPRARSRLIASPSPVPSAVRVSSART